jgi:hypothetical protein
MNIHKSQLFFFDVSSSGEAGLPKPLFLGQFHIGGTGLQMESA